MGKLRSSFILLCFKYLLESEEIRFQVQEDVVLSGLRISKPAEEAEP